MGERVLISVAAALFGAALGWLFAWATDWLQRDEGFPSVARGPLVRDPLVQSASAAVWAAAPWLVDGEWWRWVATGCLAVPLIQVGVTDFRHRYVYTVIAAVGLALGLAFGWLVQDAAWWTSPVAAAVGGVIFLVVYVLGRLIYRGREPLATGDITIAAMVGAMTASCALRAFVLGVLLGGVFALGRAHRTQVGPQLPAVRSRIVPGRSGHALLVLSARLLMHRCARTSER
jgi:prepilin signal peptidase PulO-like enzyme (type II secretory pathway)